MCGLSAALIYIVITEVYTLVRLPTQARALSYDSCAIHLAQLLSERFLMGETDRLEVSEAQCV